MANSRNRKKNNKSKSGNHDALGMTLVVVSAFLLLCIAIKPVLGVFSEAIFGVMLGVFGIAAYPMLLANLLLGVFILLRRSLSASKKTIICTSLLAFFGLVILQLASTHHFLSGTFNEYIENVYYAKYSAGGVIMGVIAFGLKAGITEIACYVVFSLAVIITVLVMTSAVSRIKNAIANRKTSKAPTEPKPAPHSMLSDDEARRVIAVGPRGGLFVERIERSSPDFAVETGVASEAPTSEKRNVSNYSATSVMDGRASDPDESRNTARFRLFGDADEIKRQSAEEFSKASRPEPKPAPKASQRVREYEFTDDTDGIAEPYERVNTDAQNADKPRRVDFDGTPGSLSALYFPPEKDIQFNDDGIENVDEMRARERKASERSIFERASAPVFDIPKYDAPRENVEKIIDASAPIKPPTPSFDPPPAPTLGISAEDRFMAAFEDLHKTPPPLETERFLSQDDIIDAYEVRSRYAVPDEPSIPVDDEPLEDIVIASNPPQRAFVAPAVDPHVPDDFSDGITDGSLIISDEPAIDMSETHDNVSDLISGDDLSGMYLSADDAPTAQKPAPPPKRAKNAPLENQITIDGMLKEKAEGSVVGAIGKQYKKYNYTPPPIDLLKVYDKIEASQEELNASAQILEDVVSRFLKAQVKVLEIVPGPQVTRYELEVPSGVTVRSIETRSADIAYEMAAVGGVRVQAPIPGKRAVGIEIPNKNKSIVGLREVVGSNTFTKHKSPLIFSVGKDVGGANIVCDLEKAPHFLIAGQTGSGKSACLNSLIVSLLYKSSPEDLRLMLIDPKRVEFSKFRGMPHLLFEKTITEPNEALNALKWAATEMDRRYTIMQKYTCSKISEYNGLPDVIAGKLNKLPHIIIIIDELANLMQSAVSGEIESKISSIAALARAAGIHLIVATQRPSADVVTGTIKANLGSRIAFKVPDATNSRIIVDEVGAEALAGDGDMLFFPQDYLTAKRVQGSFVNGDEVVAVVNYLKEHYECDFDDDAEKYVCGNGGSGSANGGDGEGGGALDPLAARVMAHGIKTKQLSTSVVQRRFSIGYARAARIIDTLEDSGYIGPSTGSSKPRDVIMTPEMYREVFGHDLEDS